MLKQRLCIIVEGDGSCSKKCYVLNCQNGQRRYCQPFTHGKQRQRERFVWGTQANFDRRGTYTQVAWIHLCTTTARLPFLSNIGFFSPWNLSSSTGCLSKTWFHFVLFNKYASNSFLRQNCAASMPIQVAMLKLQMAQGPSGGFSRWDHQGQ